MRGAAGFLLNDDAAPPYGIASYHVRSLQADNVTSPQLTVDRHVQKRKISPAPLYLKPHPDALDMHWLQRKLGASEVLLKIGSGHVEH